MDAQPVASVSVLGQTNIHRSKREVDTLGKRVEKVIKGER